MQVTKKELSGTNVQLTITADDNMLAETKGRVLRRLGKQLKLPGFRQGKAPLALIEKNLDPSTLQAEFLDAAANELYGRAIDQEKLRPVARPEVSIKKFVPFTALELDITVDILGKLTLPDYTKIKLAQKPVKITDKDVGEVIEALRTRVAEKQTVKRAAAKDDEVLIDFAGIDAKTKQPIAGADGKAYPLILGANSFIPGFEDNVIGMKPGEEKTFTLTFPKDYGVKALQNRQATFTVTAQEVKELVKPKIDDGFATKAGPFKSLAELKADIKKQLESEKQNEADRVYENELIEKIVEQSKVSVPKILVDEEIERLELEERQNLTYRGQTWQEHLQEEGVTEAEHREQKRPQAENRVKAGLVLSEIAEREKITITPEDLEVRIQLLKGQYQDKQMQAELDKPENRRDILSRMVTEKTITKLTSYAQA